MFSTTLSFRLIILLFNGVLHGGSTWWFIKDLIPSRSVHRDSFQRSSSILHLAFLSAILSTLSFGMVICHSWQFSFMFHDSKVVRNEILKPIISSLEIILCNISPKAFPKECCYCGDYLWSKFSPIPSEEEVFHLLVDLKQANVSACGRLSPHNFEMYSISPYQAYPFVVVNPTTSFEHLL